MPTYYVTIALQTALSLAEFEAEKGQQDTITITKAHLKQIVQLSADFKRYIASMHGNKTDAQIAKRDGLRNDSYGDPPSSTPRKKMFKNHFDPDEADNPRALKARAKALKNRVEDDYEEEERRKPSHNRNRKKDIKYVEQEEDSEEEKTSQAMRRARAAAYSEEEEEKPKGTTKKEALSGRELDYERHRSSSSRPKQLERRDARMASRVRYDEEEDSDALTGKRKSKKVEWEVSEVEEEE